MTKRYVIRRDHLQIETGHCGGEQECDFMNGTLQAVGGLDVTIQTFIDPAPKTLMAGAFEAGDERKAAFRLAELLTHLAAESARLFGTTLYFDVQIGPQGNDGEDDE